jgi:hypothetical protein
MGRTTCQLKPLHNVFDKITCTDSRTQKNVNKKKQYDLRWIEKFRRLTGKQLDDTSHPVYPRDLAVAPRRGFPCTRASANVNNHYDKQLTSPTPQTTQEFA